MLQQVEDFPHVANDRILCDRTSSQPAQHGINHVEMFQVDSLSFRAGVERRHVGSSQTPLGATVHLSVIRDDAFALATILFM